MLTFRTSSASDTIAILSLHRVRYQDLVFGNSMDDSVFRLSEISRPYDWYVASHSGEKPVRKALERLHQILFSNR